MLLSSFLVALGGVSVAYGEPQGPPPPPGYPNPSVGLSVRTSSTTRTMVMPTLPLLPTFRISTVTLPVPIPTIVPFPAPRPYTTTQRCACPAWIPDRDGPYPSAPYPIPPYDGYDDDDDDDDDGPPDPRIPRSTVTLPCWCPTRHSSTVYIPQTVTTTVFDPRCTRNVTALPPPTRRPPPASGVEVTFSTTLTRLAPPLGPPMDPDDDDSFTIFGRQAGYPPRPASSTTTRTLTLVPTHYDDVTVHITRTATVTLCPGPTPTPSSSSTCISSCVVDITATLLQYPSVVAQAPFQYPGAIVDVYVDGDTTSHSTVSSLEATTFPAPTWTVPQFPGVTFTYPTTYIAYTSYTYSLRKTTVSQCFTKQNSLTLPPPTNWASLIFPTSSVSTASVPPSALISYLNSQPTVTAQLEGEQIGGACDPGKGSTGTVNTPTPLTVTYTKATPTMSTRSIITPVPVPEVTTSTVPPPPKPEPTTSVPLPPPPPTTVVPPPPPPTTTVVVVPKPGTTTVPVVSIPPPPPPAFPTTTFVIATTNAGATAEGFAKAGAVVMGVVGLGFGLL